jgi:hypothetical protein
VERALARSTGWIAGALGVLTMALARSAGRASSRGSAGAVAAVGAAVAASLAVTELYMERQYQRLTPTDRAAAPGAGPSAMARPDPRLGWSYQPRRTTWERVGGRAVAYAIDADGDRAASIDDVPDPGRATVLFAGESIAFGHGLLYDETVPFLAARALQVQAINLAVVGYGNDQAYLRVLDALPRFPHTVAVVTVFVPRQIARNVDPWRPRLVLSPDGTLELVPPSSGPRIARLLQALPYHGDEGLRVTAGILRATAQTVRARGAVPLFLVTNYGRPCLRDDGQEAPLVEELFVRQGLPFVRVDLDGQDLLPGAFEWHPSARGARKLAAAVAQALAERLALSGR